MTQWKFILNFNKNNLSFFVLSDYSFSKKSVNFAETLSGFAVIVSETKCVINVVPYRLCEVWCSEIQFG